MSGFPANIANDYQILDGQFAVSYTQGGNTATVDGVTRQKLTRSQIQMLAAVGLEPTLRAFSLPTPTLGGVTPRQGDTFTDDSDQGWQVKYAEESSFGSRWIVYCQTLQG